MASSEFGGLEFTAEVNGTIVIFDIDNQDTLTLLLGGDNLQGVIGVRVDEVFITIDELDYKEKDDSAPTVTYELKNSGLRLLFNEFKQVPVEVVTNEFITEGEIGDSGVSYKLDGDKLTLSDEVDMMSKVSVLAGEYQSIDDMPKTLSNAVIAMASILYEDNTTKEIPANIKGQLQEFRSI